MEERFNILVSATSPVLTTGGSITKSVEAGKRVSVKGIGASAINQAMKAIATSRGQLAVKGLDLIVRPGFDTVYKDGEEITGMIFNLDTI